MPKPIPTAKNVTEVIDPLLDHVREAEKHLAAAAALFVKMPRALPSGSKRVEKILSAVNQLGALRFHIIADAHDADWCSDEIHAALERLQVKNEEPV